mmetsp:Transcript_1931/g.4253  ORF Transcript_1931/g.4253 Transcript_1931/m.4253 type:complete len:96 (-) Transcript_1931:187-474(-)
MPRLTPIESERTHRHLSSWYNRRSILLSPSHSLSKIPSFHALSKGWEMFDDERIDRFSDNYYRFNWGMHKGGLVLVVFLAMIAVTSLLVTVTFRS